MKQNPWEANYFSAGQEILHIILNLKFHYRIHKSLNILQHGREF